MQKQKKKANDNNPHKGDRSQYNQPLKINIPFEEAMKVVTQPVPPKK